MNERIIDPNITERPTTFKKSKRLEVGGRVLLIGAAALSAVGVDKSDAAESETFAIYTNSSEVSNDNSHKVTICHRTNSVSNPYVEIEVDTNAADGVTGNSGNKADHYGEHEGSIFDPGTEYPAPRNEDQWGDIIPPVPPYHDGSNWTPEGQAIWNTNCEVPESTESPEPTPTATSSPTPRPAITTTIDASPVVMSPEPKALPPTGGKESSNGTGSKLPLGLALGLFAVMSAAPAGFALRRYGWGKAEKKVENLGLIANEIIESRVK